MKKYHEINLKNLLFFSILYGIILDVVNGEGFSQIPTVTRKRLTIVTFIYPQTLETLHFFGILSAEISEVGRQFSIKIPNQNLIRRDIEVVITGLTRNQFVRKHTRVRIPLSPPFYRNSNKIELRFLLFCGIIEM